MCAGQRKRGQILLLAHSLRLSFPSVSVFHSIYNLCFTVYLFSSLALLHSFIFVFTLSPSLSLSLSLSFSPLSFFLMHY